jgi:hypothetical protein
MFSQEKHLDNLIRHKKLVADASILLGQRLVEQGRPELGRMVVARGFAHDNSKFFGIEWKWLHAGNDIPDEKKPEFEQAKTQHQCTNQHHPEYYGGLQNMDEISVAEMCCDWYARAQEFGTSLREWATKAANGRFHIDECPVQKTWIENFISLLLEDAFVR